MVEVNELIFVGWSSNGNVSAMNTTQYSRESSNLKMKE
jgi:hypothetical protein